PPVRNRSLTGRVPSPLPRKASWRCTSRATCNRGAKLSAEVDPIGELRIATAIGPPSLSLGHFIDGTRPPLLLNTTAASGGRVTLPSESSTMRCPREGSLRRTGGIDLGPPFRRRALQGRIGERQRYIWIFERSMPDVSIGTREHDLAAESQHLVASTRKEFLVLPASVWVEVEAAAVEVDRRLEVLPVAEAAGGVPDPLDLRVQAFGR